MIRRIPSLVLFVFALLVAVEARAHAQASTDPSTYVSTEFKTVATRVFGQLTADALATACPDSSPSCVPVAQSLAKAFFAAVSKDPGGLKGALSDFFVTSAAAAMLQTVGDIVPDDSDKMWTLGLRPLFNCVIGTMAGKTPGKVCAVSSGEEPRWSIALLNSLWKSEDLDHNNANDAAAVRAVQQALYSTTLSKSPKTSLKPQQVLRTLAVLASSQRVRRDDLRIYLLALGDWLGRGLSDGLFRATYRYLADIAAQDDGGNGGAPSEVVTLIMNGGGGLFVPSNPANPADEPTWFASSAQCPAPDAKASAAMQLWLKNRTGYLATLRNQLRLGLTLDLTPLSSLAAGTKSVQGDGNCGAGSVRNWARYISAALSVQKFRIEIGPVALSVAALIDYVRSNDEVGLVTNIEGILLYATARPTLLASNTPQPHVPALSSVEDVLRSCEYQAAELSLGLPVSRNTGSTCSALAGGPPQAQPVNADSSLSAVNAVVAAIRERLLGFLDKMPDPKAGDPYSKWLRNNIQSLLDDGHIASLEHAVSLLESGDKAGAERIVLQLGVDELVAQLDGMVEKILRTSDDECNGSARRASVVTVFTGAGAACAVHVLLKSAYGPIADYYLGQGQIQDTAQVASTVYKKLLTNSYLANTPIILNVGLGFNEISGSKTYWPNGRYTTLTLVDKIGLAFFKYNANQFNVETGIFVGGFLDAIARTLASGSTQRYWLAGYTLGLSRMFGADFGLEAHVAAALPFSTETGVQSGFALGCAFVVPLDFVFQ